MRNSRRLSTLVEEEKQPDSATAPSDADRVLPEPTQSEGQNLLLVEEPAMSHEPVLQEVTEPIAEGPSTPSPMPWDQIQEATLNIPQAEVQTAQDDAVPAATLPENVATGAAQGSHLETDQTLIPVPSESLFASMSWEEVLASIGDAAESTGTSNQRYSLIFFFFFFFIKKKIFIRICSRESPSFLKLPANPLQTAQ